MTRRFWLGAVLALVIAAPAVAQPPRPGPGEPPEKLLSPTTQFYARWDGIAAHKEAYRASVWGAVMAGPTGDSARNLLARGPKLLGSELLSTPLLNGKPLDELRAIHADLKKTEKVLDLIADQGVLVAAEVTEPRPTLGGIGRAVKGLISGSGPSPEAFLPGVRVFVIVPDAGDRADMLFGGIRLLLRQNDVPTEPLPAALGRTGVMIAQKGEGKARVANPVQTAWWVEGRHFVFYAGTAPVEAAIEGVRENAARGGLTTHPLYQRSLKAGGFEAVARGYVDAAAVVGLAKRLAGPFVPGLNDRVDAIGLGNLKAVVFASGFQGKESRALYEFDLPGERKGLAKILKPLPVTVADLPPLPPDVSRFSMLRVDLAAAYDAALTVVDTVRAGESFGEEEGKPPAEAARLRKAYLDREFTKYTGIDFREDLLPYLGDKVVTFQSPTEGLSLFGTVGCVSVKNPARVRTALDRLVRVLEGIGNQPIKVRKKVLRGVEMREVYGLGFITPTYAVVGDWLVFGVQPQVVQGVILRHKGDLERWQPDADTAARLSKMPADAIGLQFCNPKGTVQNVCCIGPLFLGLLGQATNRGNTEFDPIDLGLIPNGHELSKHLFPNLTYTRDDGATVRVEVNESFSLPGEFMGVEPLVFFGTIGAF